MQRWHGSVCEHRIACDEEDKRERCTLLEMNKIRESVAILWPNERKQIIKEANIDLERRGRAKIKREKVKRSGVLEAGRGRHHLTITGYLTLTGQWSCYTGRRALQQPVWFPATSPLRFLPVGTLSTVALANIVLCWQHVFDTYLQYSASRGLFLNIQHLFSNELLGRIRFLKYVFRAISYCKYIHAYCSKLSEEPHKVQQEHPFNTMSQARLIGINRGL